MFRRECEKDAIAGHWAQKHQNRNLSRMSKGEEQEKTDEFYFLFVKGRVGRFAESWLIY